MPAKKNALVLEKIRAARQPLRLKKVSQAVKAREAQALHVGAKNVKILVGRKRRGGSLRARLRRRFVGIMHRVITPAPRAPLQVTSFRGLPEITGGVAGAASEIGSGLGSGLGRVVKAAIGDEDEAERPKTPRIVGLRIS